MPTETDVDRCQRMYRSLKRKDFETALIEAMVLSTSADPVERVAADMWFSATAR